jgi:peptide/nickel transport system permease protein
VTAPTAKSAPGSTTVRPRSAALLVAHAQFSQSRMARASAITLAFMLLVAVFADVLAADLPIACKLHGSVYVMANVTHPAALAGKDCRSIARELGPGDFALYPVVHFGPNASALGGETLAAPSLRSGHPFGTDANGRDVFARIVHGTRTSLTFGLLTALLFVTIGALLGAVSGFFGGFLDALVTRLVETLASLPTLILVLVVQALTARPSALTMLVTIAATRWTEVTRIIRAEVIFASAQDYVVAARALGASPTRILWKHILPNVLVPALAAAPFGVAAVLLIEAAMDFLSLGSTPTAPSWGEILGEARFRPGAWWLLVFPAAALFASLVALNLVGEALRDALDPRLRDEDVTFGRSLGG